MFKTRVRDSERMLLLLEMLRSRYDHPSAQDCFLDMAKLVPGIGRSTVYRHLSKLVEENLVREIQVDDGPARYDATLETHAHFYCNKCKAMIDVDEFKVIGSWPGRMEESCFVAKGTCEKCLKAK